LTVGIVSEAYMNGGLIGVVLIAVITGLVLKVIAHLRAKCNGPWAISMYIYTVFIFSFVMTYGEFLGTYTRWLVDMFPLVLGYVFFERRWKDSAAEEVALPVSY